MKRVSLIIPAKNEAGHIKGILQSLEVFPPPLEVLFIEGGSHDGTRDAIKKEIRTYKGRINVRSLTQPNEGKKDAVLWGLKHAKGEIAMIFDADIPVAPTELFKFYNALIVNPSSMVMGTRFYYSYPKNALPKINRIVNMLFARLLSVLLQKRITDALCGTKAFTLRTFHHLLKVGAFQSSDPFGDFDFIIGAAIANLTIQEIPVHHRARTYGKSNLQPLYHGLLSLKSAVRKEACMIFLKYLRGNFP